MECKPLGEVFPILGSGLPRASGLHLTDIIKYIQDQINPYKGEGFSDAQLTMEIGFIWEDLLSYVLGNRIGKRLNDLECDGIYCNPDGLGYDPEDGKTPVVEEYKCTWRSMRKPPTDDPRWMMQIKAYCHVLGTRIAVMYICYLMGDYKGSGPQSRAFRIEFTEQEIEENWNTILAHKQDTINALAEGGDDR
jgi:hypothetical protein